MHISRIKSQLCARTRLIFTSITTMWLLLFDSHSTCLCKFWHSWGVIHRMYGELFSLALYQSQSIPPIIRSQVLLISWFLNPKIICTSRQEDHPFGYCQVPAMQPSDQYPLSVIKRRILCSKLEHPRIRILHFALPPRQPHGAIISNK